MHLLISTLVLLVALAVFAQPPDTLWTRSFGGNMLDEFYDLTSTQDGGYVMVGGTRSFGAGDIDMWVVKTDSLGNALWSRTFGGIYDDRAQAVLENPDGTLMITGRISGDTSRYLDAALLKLGVNGDSLWGHIYGGNRDETMNGVLPTDDGGYIMAGFTGSFGAGGPDFWLLRVNGVGDSLWSRTYGGPGWDFALEIQSTSDGGYALAGHTSSFDIGVEDMWLLRVNSNGDSLWSNVYGGVSLEECRGMCTTVDGGYMLVGDTDSFGGGWQGYAVKTDSVGNLEWQRSFGQGIQCIFEDVLQLPDGNYVVSGWYTYDVGDARAWLIRLNSGGDSLWSQQWGIPQTICSATSVVRSIDRGYAMVGIRDYELSWQTGDGWLLKTEEDPLGTPDFGPAIPQAISLSIYPNPSNVMSTLAFALSSTAIANLMIFDINGRLIKELLTELLAPGEHRLTVDGKSMSSGTYFVHLRVHNQQLTQKLIILK